MKKLHVQYGCGLCAPEGWLNFDASPTLRIQKLPLIGGVLKRVSGTVFPSNVLFGDITNGLPVNDDSCDALYCSHTLEHLSLADFRKALRNSYRILKPGGIFRCVVPDLETAARSYIKNLDNGDNLASLQFMSSTLLGARERPRGLKNLISAFFGNSRHLWMWDSSSLMEELGNAGFRNMRKCSFGDSRDAMFEHVEEVGRFHDAAAIESVR